MSEASIRVENLGKKYRIGRYTAGDLRNAFDYFIKKANPFQKNHEHIIPTITTEHVVNEFWALNDINFKVNKGEAVGIIGRNGAGKSTLLKILSRITEPTTGYFTLNGRVSSLLEVGTGFHMELTGRENVYLNGTILGMKRGEIKKKFDEIVAFSGVEQFIDTPVKHYSSGMKVRLAFSVAAHLEPEILVIDEVLAVGDSEFQKKCLGKMEDVTGQGRTVLFVSHNMGAVQNLCESSIYLDKGELRSYGETSSIINMYLAQSNLHSDEDSNFVSNQFYKTIAIIDKNGNNIKELFSGQFLQIRIDYSPDIIYHENLNQIIQFRNNKGDILFTLNNFHTIGAFSGKTIKTGVFCDIPKLPLNEGLYYMSFILRDGTKDLASLDDYIKIKVNKGDYFGTGKIPRPTYGMLVDHVWHINY